jgi:hypothetical protein
MNFGFKNYIAIHGHGVAQSNQSGICSKTLLSLYLLQMFFGLNYFAMVKALFDTSLFGTFAGFRNSATPPPEIMQKYKT